VVTRYDIADEVGDVLQGDASLVVPMIITMAKAYTRGHGFDGNQPNDEIAAVITTAAARFIANPKQLTNTQTSGPYSANVVGGFTGWTLAERFVLNRYRTRAM
jgi:hypothetical protein